MLAGVTLIRNGVSLGYPFRACIENMLECCSSVYVSTDVKNQDSTMDVLNSLSVTASSRGSKLHVSVDDWDLSRNMAEDHGIKVNSLIRRARGEGHLSVLYLQADEIVDPSDINRIKKTIDISRNNFYFERTYFWGDTNHINLDWTLPLARLCPIDDTLSAVEGAMTLKHSDRYPSIGVPPDIGRIYHYSRVGDRKKIADRLNTLDSLFHNGGEFEPIEEYEFGKNNNFEIGAESPKTIGYLGKHPPGVLDFYGVS